ncbi:MAG: putative glycoside hydrolase [Ardenticatenaceae bacterium]|nr:putative glycoside hydrolase [Ardenticatenaceae bacterium]
MRHILALICLVAFVLFSPQIEQVTPRTAFPLVGETTTHPGAAMRPAWPVTSPAQPTGLSALHRSGQTFITWTERADLTGERYRLYRHNQPITAATLAQATQLYEVAEGSDRFFADRYNADSSGVWRARYVDRFVIANQGSQLPAGTGLLAWTLAAADFGGGASGNTYYAVTTVDSTGAENRSDFGAANSIGPVTERVSEPAPIEILTGAGEMSHVYIQYMDLRTWNPTFHAPHAANSYYGLDPSDPAVANAIQYAYTYTVGEPNPANCGGAVPPRTPVILNLHGWGGNSYGPDPGTSQYYCAFEIRPIDVSETWYFGFARNHDYRQGSPVPAGDTIVNYTEQRLLRMVYDLLHDPILGPRVDPNRVYVSGHSMGGSGALALALRYPNVFAAAYASEPMTNYRTSGDGGGIDWRPDVGLKWGSPALNLPVQIDAPGNWADHLQRYNGTGVWDWQDHQANIQNRPGDEMVPLGLAHGRADDVIEWPTQGQPAYAAFNAGRRAWGGATTDDAHSWLGYTGLPPSLQPDNSLTPFSGLRLVRNESVPGLSNASGDVALPPPNPPGPTGGYNQTLEWSASWNAWDGPPGDTAGEWHISLRPTDRSSQTVDVTPRRLQSFHVTPGASYTWENRRVSDHSLVASGTVLADGDGLVTIAAFAVSPAGNRLMLRPAAGSPTAAPTPTNTPPAGQCVLDVNANGRGDLLDVMAVASNPGCRVYLATVVNLWRQPWPGATPTATPTRPGGAVRPLPDTTDGIHVWNDQLATWSMSEAQFQFAATHYVGSQKIIRSHADRLRAYNPNFLILHYRLGHGLGYRAIQNGCQPTGNWISVVEGNAWVQEWPGEGAVSAGWFFPWAGNPRVLNCDWGWYLMQLDDTGWRTYWRDEVLRQLAANDDDGVFMDSLSVPNYLGAGSYTPGLPAIDNAFESTWSTRIENWLSWLQSQMGSAYLIPNVGGWVTSRETTDYSLADGVMIESFGEWGPGDPFDLGDWQLQMNRILDLERQSKAIIAQNYLYATADTDSRLYYLANYVLVKGARTYLNIDLGPEPEWFPEYEIPIGAPTDTLPVGVDAWRDAGSGLYRRSYTNGLVVVNPTGTTRTLNLGSTYYRANPVGGGWVPANGDVSAWRVDYTPLTSVTLAGGHGAVLLTTPPGG